MEGRSSTDSGASSGRGIRYATPDNPYLRRLLPGARRVAEVTSGTRPPRPQRLTWQERGHIEVVDGEGGSSLPSYVVGEKRPLLEELEAPGGTGVEVSLYQAVPKGGQMDLVVEKATEVGVTRVVPLFAERGVVNPSEGKVERWRRVAEAAARQALRLRVPEVAEPVAFRGRRSRGRREWRPAPQCCRAPACRGGRRGLRGALRRPGGWMERGRDAARRGGRSGFRRGSGHTGSAARPPVSSRWRDAGRVGGRVERWRRLP